MSFDDALFQAMVRTRLGGRPLRAAVQESGVSASTLSRLLAGKLPDLESFARLVDWLGADANQFFSREGEPTARLGDQEEHYWAELTRSLVCLGVPDEFIQALLPVLRLVRKQEAPREPCVRTFPPS